MAGNIKDKEAFQRLNFLYQAAHCVLASNPDNTELARFYCQTQKTIARRLVLRQDPSVKRTICKRCCGLLVPGLTATTRQRSKRRKGKPKMTVLRCLSCGHTKRLVNDPKHQLWVDQPQALQENQPQHEEPVSGKPAANQKGAPTTAANEKAAASPTFRQKAGSQHTKVENTDKPHT